MLFVYKFDFEVGNQEKHKISFIYSKWVGKLTIMSDGVEVSRTHVLINPQAPLLNVGVGQNEKHDLRFDIKPNYLFFIKPYVKVFDGEQLIKEYGKNKGPWVIIVFMIFILALLGAITLFIFSS